MVVAVSTVQGYGSPTDRLGIPISDPGIQAKFEMADLGLAFVTTNPTPGTALAYNVQASYSATVPFLYLANTSAFLRVYLDYIKLIVTTPAASGVQAYYALIADAAARALTLDNTVALTPVCSNMALSPVSALTVRAQNSGSASTLAASVAPRVVGRGALGGITIAGDELIIDFGAAGGHQAHPGLTAAQATTPGCKVSGSPALILGPGQSLAMSLWFPSNSATGLSYELEMSHQER